MPCDAHPIITSRRIDIPAGHSSLSSSCCCCYSLFAPPSSFPPYKLLSVSPLFSCFLFFFFLSFSRLLLLFVAFPSSPLLFSLLFPLLHSHSYTHSLALSSYHSTGPLPFTHSNTNITPIPLPPYPILSPSYPILSHHPTSTVISLFHFLPFLPSLPKTTSSYTHSLSLS
ncbi:MAG: hypothetical protein J3R72DRAFT_72183 [Linnemannia gamsii]|nr:MAG: hypothetical protein J3R72DRAFT_72183 [Linnemannia gamsii]